MTIYQVGTSTARATTDTLQYNGVFLDIPFLSCRVVSPTPIAWAIGDFITWDYDGVSYRLRDIPSASKQSTSGTYGEAFVYEDVKFYSDLSKTKSVDFLDYTPYDPTIHYSSLPNFSFYGKVSDLLARIGANMARYHADWVFTADDVESGDIYDALNEYKEINVENISCWDAIKLINSEWKIGFVYYYDSTTSKHTLVAGALGGDTSAFSYGQGNGLYIVARSVSKEDSVVTRLRAYGSSENLPSRYYNNLLYADTPLIGESMYIPNLMIPYTEWGTTSSRPDVLKSYIDCNNPDVDAADTSFAKYGIRERSIFFDGNGLKEIKPTIENMTAGELRTAISAYTGTQTYFTPDVGYVNSDRMDLIKKGDDVTDDGYIEASTYYEETYAYTGDTDAEEITGRKFYHTITSFAPATLMQEGEYTLLTDGLVVTLGNAEDRSYAFSSLEVFLMKNGSRSALVSTIEGVDVTLGDLQFTVPNIDFSVTDGGDIYSLELVISATISDKDYGDTTNFAWAISAADFIYRYKKLVPNDRFTIEVRDIGFDVYKFVTAKLPAISMKTGACSGRQFRIRTSEKITGGWRLTCSRQIDDSLGSMYFPNNNTKIAALDQFVLVDLNMPDIYVEIASLRLYNEAIKWLRKNKETQYVYEPKIDEIYMALNPQVIKEGMSMPVTDTDLGIDNTVLINSVTINENGDGLRTYDVVLRDGTDETLLGYIDSKSKGVKTETVKFIVNAATPKTQSASETRIGLEAATLGYDDSLLWKAISAKLDGLDSADLIRTRQGYVSNMNNAGNYLGNSTFYWTPNTIGKPDWGYGVCLAIKDSIDWNNQFGFGTNGELYFRQAINTSDFTDISWAKLYHSGNSNSTLINWSAAKLTSTTLLLPQTTPTLSSGEVAIYSTDSGFSGELPSGAGSVTSIALTMPTGFSVSGSPITESGTFGVTFASDYFLPTTTQFATKLDVSLKGTPNGLAELDENGFVKNTQLPSYVDDVLEYDNLADFPATGEGGKIYIAKDTNKTYRWSGTGYAVISETLALGETSSTAYRGDRGKIAYDHSQLTGNPHGTTAAQVGALGVNDKAADSDKLDGYNSTDFKNIWTSVITIGTWSRLASVTNINLGGSLLLTIQYTRGSVVVNNTFLISFGHFYSGNIITLGTHDYTQISLRLSSITDSSVYIEMLDNAAGIGTQSIRCSASKIDCTLTPITTFNEGTGTALIETTTEFGSIKINNNKVYHSGNSNSTSFNWSAAKLTSTTLLLPQTAPSLSSGEVGIYALDSGFSGELPSGSGSVTSIALTMPAGFSVSGSPITESGTFGVTFASGYFLPTTTQFATKLDVSLKGTPNGLAELDENGFVKNTQLPSYVDDVLEGTWINTTTFNNLSGTAYTPEGGKIYVDTTTNKTWRWSGSIYAEISASLALGEDQYTAYRGDRGKTAYDYSQIGHLPLSGGTLTGGLIGTTISLYDTAGNAFKSQYANGYAPFTINSDLAIGQTFIGWNIADYNKYAVSDYAIRVDGSRGNFIISTATSGTAGAEIAFTPKFTMLNTGAATFASTVSATGFTASGYTVYHTGNLTNTLTPGNLPYWDGSSLVNSGIYRNGDNYGIGLTSSNRPLTILSSVSDKIWLTGGSYQNGLILDVAGAANQYYIGAGINMLIGNGLSSDRGIMLGYNTSSGRAAIFFDGAGAIKFGSSASGELGRFSASGNFDIGYGGTRSEKLAVNGSGFFASSVQMNENINTNLRIPKVAPTSPKSGEYYFYIVE